MTEHRSLSCVCGRPVTPQAVEAARLTGSVRCAGCDSLLSVRALERAAPRSESMTDLEQARDHVRSRLDAGGVRCPCCGQFAKRYKRKLSSIMACWLIAFRRAQKAPQEWMHVDRVALELRSITSIRSGDYGKLRFWGLLEPREVGEDAADEDKKASGVWQLTVKGAAFVAGEVKVPRYALVFDNALQGYDGEEIGVQEALGSRFSYTELMTA